MNFREKLKFLPKKQVWEEYCGFLDLKIKDYMFIQNRLMEEQLALFRESGLGKRLMMGSSCNPNSIDEFRATFPMTRYEDYADILLAKRVDLLPADPVIWIETTWEGGFRPVKVAPYTRAMLDTYKHNVFAVMMLASGHGYGDFNVTSKDRILYGGAPLPYMTGLLPSLLNEDMDFVWLPDTNSHSDLSFSQRIKAGFKMGLRGGVDYFFAIGSVANYITEHFEESVTGGSKKSSGLRTLFKVSPAIAYRFIKAKSKHHEDGGKLVPGDVFHLKGFVSTGTDAVCYRERLSKAWGVEPIELAAGTESTCLAVSTWEHRGMVFFPDACFYEFIPESELQRERETENYTPRTCLMDGVSAGESYELVISVLHGGAFMRYRIGDMYHCVSAPADGSLPRFTYIDRTPDLIDIAGFTRITEASITEVIHESRLPIGDWTAKKEYDTSNTPFMHLYAEIKEESLMTDVALRSLIQEHLALYFKNFDSDYSDLKKLLDMEPLQITMLKTGTIKQCESMLGRPIRHINPPAIDIQMLTGYRKEHIPSVMNREE